MMRDTDLRSGVGELRTEFGMRLPASELKRTLGRMLTIHDRRICLINSDNLTEEFDAFLNH